MNEEQIAKVVRKEIDRFVWKVLFMSFCLVSMVIVGMVGSLIYSAVKAWL